MHGLCSLSVDKDRDTLQSTGDHKLMSSPACFASTELSGLYITVSLLLVPLAPVGQYLFLQDYWRPPVLLPIVRDGRVFGGAADLLFSFVMGGLATAAYPVLLNKHPVAGLVKQKRLLALSFILVQGVAVISLTGVFHINSIFASAVGFLGAGAITLLVRRDLWSSAIVSGLLCGIALAGAELILSFIVPLYLTRYWLLYHTPAGILIFGRVPLTEAMWGATFGFAIGPLYDAFEGYVLKGDHVRFAPPPFITRLLRARAPTATPEHVEALPGDD